jgi:hypothetical protein
VSEPCALLIHLGREPPPWLGYALRQLRCFGQGDIHLIAEADALRSAAIPSALGVTCTALEAIGVSDKQREFRRLSPLDRNFRDGFWTFTSERFFVIETAMSRLGLAHVVHLENDVMIYRPIDELGKSLARVYRAAAATFDNDTRCVPGIVYLPDTAAIGVITDFYLRVLRKLRASASAAVLNDMSILGALRSHFPHLIEQLPIVPPDYPAPLRSAAGHTVQDATRYSQHFASLGCIFDAAALGQFLGGVDPRNATTPSIGFVNESCVFHPAVLRPRLVRDASGRRVPVVDSPSGTHPVANLHVHSKNLAAFLSA